jgi:hypothetical protein
MTRAKASALRDEIKAAGLHCTIPRGGTLPRIFTTLSATGELSFNSRGAWMAYRRKHEKQKLAAEKAAEWLDRQREKEFIAGIFGLRPARSPIEAMIDKACGITK